MSLKEELEIWQSALEAYDSQEFERCLDLFETIAISSKILFNIGLVQATIGSHDIAVRNFEAAVQMDEYLAIAFFQAGVSEFLLGRYAAAKNSFNTAYLLLRANLTIDYDQLGLKFRLFSCEILFNRGLCSIYLGKQEEGMNDLDHARKEKQTEDHSVIDEAFEDRGKGYTVFSIPVGVLYRPSANKIKNIAKKDYLGTARVVATTDIQDVSTGFNGTSRDSPRSPPARPSELNRSKTSGARLQASEGLITPEATPLRRRATEAKLTTVPIVSRGPPVPNKMQRSNTITGNPGPRTRPPTPPSSTEHDRKMSSPIQRLATSKSYDANLIDDYYDAEPTVPSGQPSERVENWARETIRDPPSHDLLRSLSTSTSGSGRNIIGAMTKISPSIGSLRRPGGSINRGVGSVRRVVYDDGYEETQIEEKEMIKIRIKLRYQDETRGMSIGLLSHDSFIEQVKKKLGLQRLPSIKYKDSTNELISIVDEGDWESAIDEAREAAGGRAEGKLEIHLS